MTERRTGEKGAALVAPHRRREGFSPAHLLEPLGLYAYRTGAWLISHIPDRLAYRLLGWAMLAGYWLAPKKRRWVELNFSHVLGVEPGHPAARRMARRAYYHYGHYVTELMKLPSMGRDAAAEVMDPGSVDSIEAIWKSSKGVILVAAHLANNEAGMAGVASRGWPMNVVADDTSFEGIFELLEKQRAAWGVKVVPWRNLREVFRCLRRREFLTLLVDWGYHEDGIPVLWFDAWTRLPAGPAVLAAKTGASIVPVFMRRAGDWRFEAAHAEPILVSSTDPREILHATQKMADALEAGLPAMSSTAGPDE